MAKSKLIHIAVASLTSKPGKVAENLEQIAVMARRAGVDGADVLLTPELSAVGYGPYPESIAQAEIAGQGPIYKELVALAAETGVVLLVGFIEADGEKRHLSHYIVYPDGKYLVQRKHRVTLAERPLDAGVELEPPDYINNPPLDPADPGQPKTLDFTLFDIKGVRCAIAICADGGITNLDQELVARGVELVFNPAGAGGVRADRVTSAELATTEGRATYMRVLEGVFFPAGAVSASLEHGIARAAVNMCGYDGLKQYHVGHGMIITAMGEVPGLIHGIPNLDRQRPLYAHAEIDVLDKLPR